MKPLFQFLADLAKAGDDEIRSFIETAAATARAIGENPTEYVNDERSMAQLTEEMSAGVAAITEARAELKTREEAAAATEPVEPTEPSEPTAEEAATLAELAAQANESTEPEPAEPTEPSEPTEPTEPAAQLATEPEPAEPGETKVVATVDPEVLATVVEKAVAPLAEAITAALTPATEEPKPVRLARPSRSRRAEPLPAGEATVSLVAAADNLGIGLGTELDAEKLAELMVKRRYTFGDIPLGTHGDKVVIASADWRGEYPAERVLSGDIPTDMDKIEAVVAAGAIRDEFEKRRKEDPESLVASGGLCAPVTPYYQLANVSIADRPVRAALPSFNADRGGIRFAAPAHLSAIDDAVGIITEAEDAAGGASGTKTCQVIDCPPFSEVDVAAIYHCLQFGNLGARAFPELVQQWTDLTLAAHSRTGDSALLDGIRAASTKVTAANTMDLGASAQLPSQILTAAAGMRSRHRMDPEAVLRVLLPEWTLDLLVSDVYRSQFQRFDMSPERFVALLRQGNVEPSFYIDGATGRSQIIGAQANNAALLTFPSTLEWYLYPEGSFLYVDGGTLELGLVRDSVLNATNDFQIFGETWENVAFIGVESLAVTSTLEDTGAVTAPNDANSVSY